MTRTIVVPLDRSPVAERAIPFATSLARQIAASVTLLSVIDLPFEFAAWLDATTIVDEKIEVEYAYEDYLQELAPEIDGIPVDTVVRIGDAATEIQRYVETLEDPIVVMASHGRSGISRLLVGSVTQQVVHRLHDPVIVVPARVSEDRQPVADRIRSVLIPLDGSGFAEYALEFGLNLLGTEKPDVHLLRVVELASWHGDPYAGFDLATLELYFASSQETATEYLNEIAGGLRERGYLVTTEARRGFPADQINEVAVTRDADFIIMATHGRSGLGRLIFGSVAERALRQVMVPLMLVRPGPELMNTSDVLTESMSATMPSSA